MSESDRRESEARVDASTEAPPSANLREALRSIAHDLNGELNGMALNVELLDRATATIAGADASGGGRERHFANLRRSVRRIHEILESRLLPLGRDGDPLS